MCTFSGPKEEKHNNNKTLLCVYLFRPLGESAGRRMLLSNGTRAIPGVGAPSPKLKYNTTQHNNNNYKDNSQIDNLNENKGNREEDNIKQQNVMRQRV